MPLGAAVSAPEGESSSPADELFTFLAKQSSWLISDTDESQDSGRLWDERVGVGAGWNHALHGLPARKRLSRCPSPDAQRPVPAAPPLLPPTRRPGWRRGSGFPGGRGPDPLAGPQPPARPACPAPCAGPAGDERSARERSNSPSSARGR